MDDFLEQHKNGLEHLGFWKEMHKGTILSKIEESIRTEVIREFGIEDIVAKNDGKFLIKWVKRLNPLTDEDLKQKYGR